MNTPAGPQPSRGNTLQDLLAAGAGPRRLRRWLIAAGALALVATAAVLILRGAGRPSAPAYRTEPVTVGPLVVKVSATGKLQPTNQVDVGSELSGIVEKVFVDDNDLVTKGEVLARLDPSKLKDAVTKSRASLAAADAQVLQAEATMAETQATLERYRQVAQLSGGKVPSRAELDGAVANVKRAEANQASARASVAQAKAGLQSDETNLSKATIRSPIDGVVLARKVEPGQTVAASFQAPILFTLAEDLSKMELQVDVDEADVGQVKVGQQAAFTVDAWPDRQYAAVITRVGYGSQEKEGVVSYLTVLEVANDDLSLRPGMTGTAEITTLSREKALLAPNGALRFSPSTTAATPKRSGGVLSALMPRPPHPAAKATGRSNGAKRVWVLRDGQPVPIDVTTGATNGRMTEIVGGSLEAGMQVIIEALGGG